MTSFAPWRVLPGSVIVRHVSLGCIDLVWHVARYVDPVALICSYDRRTGTLFRGGLDMTAFHFGDFVSPMARPAGVCYCASRVFRMYRLSVERG